MITNQLYSLSFWGILSAIVGNCAYAQVTPLPAEVRVSNETLPPGSTVQLKYSLTEPRPIMTGTSRSALDTAAIDSIFGVSLFSPAGDAFGVAHYRAGQFGVQYISPLNAYGTFVDYPILTVTAHIRNDAPVGYQSVLTLADTSTFSNLLGQTFGFAAIKPGRLTVGGSIAIHNVIPGGGIWPAGTTVRILGMGFSPATRVKTKFKASTVRYVSSTEIDVVLDFDSQIDSQRIDVSNPDGSEDRYFPYLRGVEDTPSANAFLTTAEPVFPSTGIRNAAIVQAPKGFGSTVDTALAMQNSNSRPVTVVLTASTATGQVGQVVVTLDFGKKITRELGEYFGKPLAAGTVVRVAASAPVQLVPFYADSAHDVLTPFAPQPL